MAIACTILDEQAVGGLRHALADRAHALEEVFAGTVDLVGVVSQEGLAEVIKLLHKIAGLLPRLFLAPLRPHLLSVAVGARSFHRLAYMRNVERFGEIIVSMQP